MKFVFGFLLLFLAFSARAQELEESTPQPTALNVDDNSRDPAALPKINTNKRTYPGGGDEEDLQVQTTLPDATIRIDARSVQREVYKSLYNQEMKEERQESLEE